MFPKVTNGRVDPQLTNVLQAYRNQQYVAGLLFPTVPNLKDETGLIPSMGQDHLHSYSTRRALYDESDHRINFTIDNSDSYRIDYFDLSVYLPDRLQRQVQKPFNMRSAAQFTVMEALMLEREIAAATALTSTSVLTNNTTLSGTSQYTDTVNSTPGSDIDAGRDSVQGLTGKEPNAIHMSRGVMNALRRHPFFLEIAIATIQGVGQKTRALSETAFIETLKAWWNFEYVTIGRAINITSRQGQTVTKAAVWGDDIVIYYRPSGPSLFEPSFGYSFSLAGENMRSVVRRHRNDKGDEVEVMWAYQDKILDVDSGYLIKDAI